MKTWKRILALLGAVGLFVLYAGTLVFALIDSPLCSSLLKISVAATILLPVILYACILFSRLIDRRDDDASDSDS